MADQGPGGLTPPGIFNKTKQTKTSEYITSALVLVSFLVVGTRGIADESKTSQNQIIQSRPIEQPKLDHEKLDFGGDSFEPETLLGQSPPYVPRKYDYSLAFGYMSDSEDLFIGSVGVGYGIGNCWLMGGPQCEQYLDVLGGLASREAKSHGMLLGSLRWQYVRFPSRHSPYWRVFLGTDQIRGNNESGWRTLSGVGIGITTYLHSKADLNLELRTGVQDFRFDESDRLIVQVLLGVQIKVDRLLQSFVLKLRDFGYGTVSTAIEAAGTAIEATGEGLSGLAKGVSSSFKKDDQSQRANENPEFNGQSDGVNEPKNQENESGAMDFEDPSPKKTP